MKNLLVYLNPRKGFDKEHKILAKIQIDNSLSLGWKKEDILLVTNFEYEYNGIRALVIDDKFYCTAHARASKITALIHLFDRGLINDLFWLHDFDAFQLLPIEESELGLKKDVGFTDYGWSPKWNTGSIFLKEGSRDIFVLMRDLIYKHTTSEEMALVMMEKENPDNINDRYQRLNTTYNFGIRNVGYNYKTATKPLKVIHFHPAKKHHLDIFLYGKNELNLVLIPDRLIKIFRKYGY